MDIALRGVSLKPLRSLSPKDTEMKTYTTSFASRLIASVVAVGVTLGLFSAVVAPAMQPQIDGSLCLANAVGGSPHVAAPMLVAQADTTSTR